MVRLSALCSALFLLTPSLALAAPDDEAPSEKSADAESDSPAKQPKATKGGTASADGESTKQAPEADKTFSHFLQFGLRTSLLAGYRMVFRYDDSPFCKQPDPMKGLKDQQKFCGHMGPALFDVAASFAPLGPIEPFAFARFGLVGESQTDTSPLKMIGAGVRIYTRSSSSLKIFVEPSVAFELEKGYGNRAFSTSWGFTPNYGTDLVFRAAVGPHWDVHRNVGVYAQVFGMSVGILRAISATMEFGAGVQARF